MTQQNAALVEESTAAAASMRDQAQKLAEVVSMFNVGAVAARAPVAPPLRPAPAVGKPAGARPAAVGASTAGKAAKASTPRLGSAAKAAPAATAPAAAPKAAAPRAAAGGGDDDWESF
jgi:hypothetical protein